VTLRIRIIFLKKNSSIINTSSSFRYYYAVIECDKLATARSIYESCDGAEFERSANFFDLRYIPDEMTFDDTPRDTANHAPENYKPLEYVTEVSRQGAKCMMQIVYTDLVLSRLCNTLMSSLHGTKTIMIALI
jgi:hypothetical protein